MLYFLLGGGGYNTGPEGPLIVSGVLKGPIATQVKALRMYPECCLFALRGAGLPNRAQK